MIYERMKYRHDQRAWVMVADEKLPDLIAKTRVAQLRAAEAFRDWNDLTTDSKQRYGFVQGLISEAYAEAHVLLGQVLFYEGMRRANLPREE
jgi:hypothetical protein